MKSQRPARVAASMAVPPCAFEAAGSRASSRCKPRMSALTRFSSSSRAWSGASRATGSRVTETTAGTFSRSEWRLAVADASSVSSISLDSRSRTDYAVVAVMAVMAGGFSERAADEDAAEGFLSTRMTAPLSSTQGFRAVAPGLSVSTPPQFHNGSSLARSSAFAKDAQVATAHASARASGRTGVGNGFMFPRC